MKEEATFQMIELDDAVARARASPDGYAPAVIRSELLSVGLYTLVARAVDSQSPHMEDEVYVAIRGRAMLSVEGHDHPVRPGSILYVPAGAEHRFHDIVEDLELVVFWAPPEAGSARKA